jgi:hypothetical protein
MDGTNNSLHTCKTCTKQAKAKNEKEPHLKKKKQTNIIYNLLSTRNYKFTYTANFFHITIKDESAVVLV